MERVMKYKVYQIHLTDAEYDMVNAKGHDSVEKQTLKLDMSLMKSDTKSIAQEAFDKGYYTHVSNINAPSLDKVFEYGNIGPEYKIERLSPMYSVSVGDIIEDESGVKNVVASFGFETLEKEAA